MKRSLALALGLAAVAPQAAYALVPAAEISAETVAVPTPTSAVGCAEHRAAQPPYADCVIYSGSKVTLRGSVHQGDGTTPLGTGWAVRLRAFDIKSPHNPTSTVKTVALGASTTTFTLVGIPKTSTIYAAQAIQNGQASPSAQGRTVWIYVKARVIDQSKSFQTGHSFAFKGRVAFIPGFGGGTFKLQRCRQRSASYCKRTDLDARWSAPVYTKAFNASGTWGTTVAMSGTGKFYFRLLFKPKNGKNIPTILGETITRS